MSLQILLSDFPNYPARKVRALAKQLRYLEQINSKEAKGIGQDLLDYHLQSAKLEERLNDDVATPTATTTVYQRLLEPVRVTPVSEALRAIELVQDRLASQDPCFASARGIVQGSSFTAVHEYISVGK